LNGHGGGKAAAAAESEGLAGGLQRIKEEELTLLARLGSGSFAEVHSALWNGSEVAVKRVHQIGGPDGAEAAVALLGEAAMARGVVVRTVSPQSTCLTL
jgi:hypothetical protein